MLKSLVATASLVAVTYLPIAFADNATDAKIASDALKIINEAKNQPVPEWLKGNKHDSEAKQAVRSMTELLNPKHRAKQQRQKDPMAGTNHYLIYVSHSMDRSELDRIARDVSGRQDVVLVFRGIRPDQGLGEGIREIQNLALGFSDEKTPNIIIDPTKFQRDKVTGVPYIVYREEGRTVLEVSGNSNLVWVEEKVTNGYNGDLGTYGPTKEILEPDLIEVMKQRVAKIDWAEKKRKAVERYWSKQTFYPLPTAQDYREREIDPTVMAVKDLKDHKGNVLVFKGQRFNPFDQVPFSQLLIIFNGQDKDQIAKARELRAASGEFQRVTYITTEVDRSRGWEHVQEIENSLDAPVYQLTPEVLARFHLEKVPATVTGRNRMFVVTEYPTKERIGDNNTKIKVEE